MEIKSFLSFNFFKIWEQLKSTLIFYFYQKKGLIFFFFFNGGG